MDAVRLEKGIGELEKLGFVVRHSPQLQERDGFFAGSSEERRRELLDALNEPDTRAVICARGGYGSNYVLSGLTPAAAFPTTPKLFIAYSDATSLQLFFWKAMGWTCLYGPMVAAGLDSSAGAANGFDAASFARAVSETGGGWSLDLGETISAGTAEGILLGGCLTLIETALGTGWELDTRGAILVLEDRGMKPWQVDRALMHLLLAGKVGGNSRHGLRRFPGLRAAGGHANCARCGRAGFASAEDSIVRGAPVGHTRRPMLTVPLGVRARIAAEGAGRLDILEPACQE